MKSVWCDCNDDVIFIVALYKNKLGLVKVLSAKGEGQMSFHGGGEKIEHRRRMSLKLLKLKTILLQSK